VAVKNKWFKRKIKIKKTDERNRDLLNTRKKGSVPTAADDRVVQKGIPKFRSQTGKKKQAVHVTEICGETSVRRGTEGRKKVRKGEIA